MVTSLYESKNRCYSRSRIAEAKFTQIIRFFAMDFTASDTAKLTNISVRSIHTIYIKLHKRSLSSVKKYLPSMASLNWMNPTSMPVVFEVNEVEVLQVKRLYSVCLNEMEVFIKKLFLIVPKPRYKELFVGI